MKTRPWIDVSELDSPGDPEAENAVMAASYILFQLSGQRFGGVFETTEQYTCETAGAPVGCSYDPGVGGYWNPTIGSYTYVLKTVGRRPGAPGGDIRLRSRPVRQITEVSVGGLIVDPSQYDLYNSAIFRPSALVSWGLCSSPVITYEYGSAPNAMGRLAARKLANELLLASNGSTECQLPSNVTSISRQGLTMTIFDPNSFLNDGLTGVYEVDIFLKSINPGRAAKRPRVFSPDLPRSYRHS